MNRHFDQLYADHWGILEVMISDRSPIDLKRLKIRDYQDASEFIRSYGYNLDDPDEAAELEKLRHEALNFVQMHFLTDLEPDFRPLSIPSTIQYADTQELLLLASGNPRSDLQKWACAVLRVMHTLSHVMSDLAVHYFPDIQQQVLGPYYKHIHRDERGKLWLGHDENRLELIDFEVKAGKERDSAVLKLLHKRENVASDIFDRIGVRFVTRDRLDSVLAMCYLREHHLVSFPNVKPSRSINTLIHIDKFRKSFKSHYEQFRRGELSAAELESYLRNSAQFDDVLSHRQIQHLFNRNPYTSSKYRAIQFTVRQLVRIVNPLHAYKSQVDSELKDTPVMRERFYSARPHYRFYFPYEVQIVDINTHQNNTSGQASHEEYKRRQVIAARRRVLDRLLKKTTASDTTRSHFERKHHNVNIAHEYPGHLSGKRTQPLPDNTKANATTEESA